MDLWHAIGEELGRCLGRRLALRAPRTLGGGCINRAFRVEDAASGEAFFVKLNQADRLDMFAAEAAGLEAILETGTLRAPRPLARGVAGDQAWLALEYLPFGHGGRGAMARLGEGLAAMHRATAARFGWHRDNTIGATPQPNPWTDDWPDFWREHRLGHQLALAARNGHGGELQRLGEAVMERVPALLAGHRPRPSLLHGDLWSGNQGVLEDGTPVIFDPAVYYGDREADLAMTELFGGFGAEFQAAYRAAWPLEPGYALRRTLYNLYHILNHLNLFGGGYLGQALAMCEQLLAATRG